MSVRIVLRLTPTRSCHGRVIIDMHRNQNALVVVAPLGQAAVHLSQATFAISDDPPPLRSSLRTQPPSSPAPFPPYQFPHFSQPPSVG